MNKTYLRYECADSFGLTTHTGSIVYTSGTRGSTGGAILTTGGSAVNVLLHNSHQRLKLAHREPTNIGTGRALNSSEVLCIDTASRVDNSELVVATGWSDGFIRVFDQVNISTSNSNSKKNYETSVNTVHSENEFIMRHRDPLSFNGHNGSSVKVVKFDASGNRLASAGTNGDIVVWDVLAETGLFRLLGHKGQITSLYFFHNSSSSSSFDGLVSSCLDGFVKVWDLAGQCCIQTLTGHRSEVWSADIVRTSNTMQHNDEGTISGERWRLITGASDTQLRVWSLQAPSSDNDNNDNEIATYIGSINRQSSSERVEMVKYHPNGGIVGVLSHNSKNIEIYLIRSVDESQKRRTRRLRRRREKASVAQSKSASQPEELEKQGILDDDVKYSKQTLDDEDTVIDLLEDNLPVDIVKASDEMEFMTTLKSAHKIKGFSFASGKGCRIAISTATNAVETYSINKISEGEYNVSLTSTHDMDGHPTGIRSVSLSSDDTLACTISKGAAKVWNVSNRSCVRALPLKIEKKNGAALYALCCAFLPGNDHVVVGTRDGRLIIFDYATGDIIFAEDEGHTGAIWSLDVRPDGSGLMTGGADHMVKFWDFEQGVSNKPILVHTRTLKMTDDVVAVRFSYNQSSSKRLIAVSTLDSTIKVFFDDSLKFFLSLYGHKLPALALDCSDDDMLLASAGADKTIKIWGLDFGDTHRTLHGHTDSITDLRFVRRTHNFFTSSKDKSIRYWDADKFEQILLLSGHIAEVNCLAMSRSGGFLLSGSMDRQVRVWERTKDIVFLEEEKERELEKMFEKVDGSRGESRGGINGDEDEDDNWGENEPQSEAAVKKSVLSVASGDRIAEAIENADQEMKERLLYKKSGGDIEKRKPNPLLIGLEPHLYMLWVLRTVKSAELEQSLLVLPLSHIERLIYYLVTLLRRGLGVELCAKAAIFLVKTHENQVSIIVYVFFLSIIHRLHIILLLDHFQSCIDRTIERTTITN